MSHPPLPSVSRRDDMQRLISLCYESTPPLLMPETNPLLIAIDASDNALRAVSYAIQQAKQMNTCALHLIHVESWLSREAAETELAQRAWIASERARTLLNTEGRPWRLHVTMGDVAENILHLAAELRCNSIIVGNRGLGVTEGLLLGSVTSKLVHTGAYPLTVVP